MTVWFLDFDAIDVTKICVMAVKNTSMKID